MTEGKRRDTRLKDFLARLLNGLDDVSSKMAKKRDRAPDWG